MTPPASGEAALARLRSAEADLQAFLETVGHAESQAAQAAARTRANCKPKKSRSLPNWPCCVRRTRRSRSQRDMLRCAPAWLARSGRPMPMSIRATFGGV